MDITSILDAGGYVHENPAYNPKTKKGQLVPKYLVNDNPYGAINQGSTLASVVENVPMAVKNLDYLGNPEKYAKYGITPSPIGNLTDELADAQSNWSKAINALGQTLVSEIGLGTLRGASDLIDAVGQAVGLSDHNYSNPVSQYLEQKQKEFEEWAPVYVNSQGNTLYSQFTGNFNLGYWFSNLPSVASSLTLLIPSTGITKGLSALGKASKISKYTNRAARAVVNPMARAIGRSGFSSAEMGVAFETGINAALSRTMENYQEARQTYNDTYIDTLNSLNGMSDDEYNEFLQRNAKYLEDNGISTTNKDEVAKQIARTAADRTFKLDFANVVFDAYQIYGLRNLLTHAPKFNKNAKVRAAQRNSIRTANMNEAEATDALAKDSKLTKVGNFVSDNLLGFGRQIKSELSEGVEEAVNYIAQQEGNHLGKYLLTGKDGNEKDLGLFSSIGPMTSRILNDYINDTGLWDSAFWGVLGGVVFQAGGSKLNRISQTIKNRQEEKKSANKDNAETQEAKLKPHWWALDQSSETERMLGEINGRSQRLNKFREAMQMINAGKNPYIKNEDKSNRDISSPVEERMLREKAYTEYLDELIVTARNNGTLDMLKAYLEDANVRNAIVAAYQSGDSTNRVSKEEAEAAAAKAVQRLEKIDRLYQDEILHASDIADRVGDKEGTSLPAEYIQMVASSNVRHKLNLERYDEVAALYNEDTERIKQVLGDKFDSSIDYQGLIALRATIQELSSLIAQKKELEAKQKENPTFTTQYDIEDLDKQISLIKRKALQTSTDAQFARTIYALQVANSAVREYSPDGKNFKVNASDTDLIANLDEFLLKDLSSVFDEVGQEKRNVSNDAVLGELRKIMNDMRYVLPVNADGKRQDKDSYLETLDPKLPDNYDILARIELEKIKETAAIAETEQEIRQYIGAINNFENIARREAIKASFDTLVDIQKRHPDINLIQIANGIYDKNNADWLIQTNGLSDEERNNIREALKILNLADVKNRNLFGTLTKTLITAMATQMQVDANDKQNTEPAQEGTQNSSTSQSTNTEQQSGQPINQSGQPQQAATTQRSGQIEQPQEQNTPTQITLLYNGNTINYKVQYINDDTDNGIISVKDLGNGNFELEFVEKGTNVKPEDISNPKLFDVRQQPMDGAVVKRNPIVRFGDNNEIQVVSQGLVENPSISSTGEVTTTPTQPQPAATETPASEAATPQEPETPVRGADPGVYIPQIASAARAAAMKLKNGENVTYEEYLVSLTDVKTIINDDVTFEKLAKEHWNSAMQRLAKKYPDVVDNIINILQSSTTEEIPASNLKRVFDKNFTSAVEKLVKAYLKDIGQKKVNGKYVISLENLLRYCNGEFQNNENAEILYSVLANYLKSDAAKNLYDVIESEQEIAAPEFLDNVKTPLEERVDKAIREESHRINTSAIKNKEIFDELEEGQELTITQDTNRIHFHFDGKEVGYIGKPRVVNGTYSSPYEYFLFSIRPNGKDTYYSKLADVFKAIVNAKDGDLKEIYDAALSGKISLKDNATWKAIKDEYGIHTRDNETGEEYDDVDDRMLRVIRTMAGFAVKYGSADKAIDGWFNALAQEYIAADSLAKNKDTKVVVDSISDGYIIRATEKLTDDNGNIIQAEVDKLPLVSKAIGKNNKGKVSLAIGSRSQAGAVECVVKKENDKVIIPATYSFPGVGYSNSFVAIPISKGRVLFAQAFPITARELTRGSEAAKIVGAFSNQVTKYLEAISQNPDNTQLFKELQDFLFEALNYKNNTTPLFHMDNCEKVNVGDNRGTHIGTNGRRGPRRDLRIFCNPGKTHKIQIQNVGVNETIDITSANISRITNLVRQFLADTVQFNISEAYIASDNNTRNQVEGLATRDKDGKFVVKIGDESWTFDSYNDFILDNDLVRVNTKPNEHGNNVTRTSSNPNIRYKIVTSSPVERSPSAQSATVSSQDILTQANQIMGSDRTDKAAALARLIFNNPEEDIVTTLTTYGLLPTNLVFDSNFNTGDGRENLNASFNKRTKVTTIGPRFLAMLSNPNEAYRKQAVRKLIHERLHDILHSDNNEHYINDIRNIYEQFVQYNKDNNADEKYTKYEYRSITSEEERLEEFLVDSLTSQELANYLNSIKTLSKVNMREKKRDTLLNKIMRLLAKIMGVRIKNDSLYAQEFEALRKTMDSTAEQTLQFEETSTEEIKQKVEQPAEETRKEEQIPEVQNKNLFNIINDETDDEEYSSTTEEYKSNDYTQEMLDIKEKAIGDGTFMKAPNGKPTNLTERQWLQVRTKAFKDWFGDWINDSENASKVVDENGEPLVVYRGTRPDSTVYNTGQFRSKTIFGTQKKVGASRYGEPIALFMSIKNPAILDYEGKEYDVRVEDEFYTPGLGFTSLDRKAHRAVELGYDGMIVKNVKDGTNYPIDDYITTNPNQIKSATDNNGEFSTDNNDIRYSSTTEEIESNLLYQKQLLTEQIRALRNIKESINKLGSTNAVKTILKDNNVNDDIINSIIKAVANDSNLGKYTPLSVYRIIRQLQETGLQKDYNTYVEEPINRRLEELLINYLKPFNVTILEDDVVDKYGVIGLYDILNKTIHIAKNRNSITLTEEFAHAFVELMGSRVSSREENSDYSFLYRTIDTTSLYKQVYEQYKDTYTKTDKDGNTVPDLYKIKKEAIGQALATAINNAWSYKVEKEERNFWQKLKDWFNSILDYFNKLNDNTNEFLGIVNKEGYIDIEALLNKIANEIINNNRERLRKVDDKKYKLLNYAETINQQTQKDGGRALDFMQWYTSIGNIITGSLAYRRQGTVYRSSIDALHDIDMIVPKDTHKIDLHNQEILELLNNRDNQKQVIDILLETPYFKKVIDKYPDLDLIAAYPDGKGAIVINSIWSKNNELKDKFKSLSGSYEYRLEQFTKEERDQIYLFDFFLKPDNSDESFIENDTDIRLSRSYVSFKSKLAFGRAKDIYDYQMWKLYDEFKTNALSDNEYLMYQRPNENDTIYSSTSEEYENVASIADYIQSYPPEDRAEIARKINSGEISIKCK